MNSGAILIFIAAILWGLDGILRRALFDVPPITIVFYEHLIGLILLSPFLIRAWKQEKLTSLEWGAIGIIALFSGVLGTLFFTSALLAVSFIPFSVVFLLQKLQPIFAVGTAALVLKERITAPYLTWALVALIAGYFMTFPEGVHLAEDGNITAALLAFGAAVVWGSSTAFSRFALLSHDTTFITGLRFLFTVPLALVVVLLLGAAPTLTAVSLPQFGVLGLIAVSTGMLALWIYYRGLKNTPASISTIVELAFPATAIAIDYFLYDTVLAPVQYFAAAVLLFAMYQVTRGQLAQTSSS